MSLQALQRMFQNLNPQRKDHSFLNNHCTLRGHSIIMFALRGGEVVGSIKIRMYENRKGGGCINANVHTYIFLIYYLVHKLQ